MTEERLKKSNELLKKIKDYKQEIDFWEKADSFRNRKVQLLDNNDYFEVCTTFIDFEVMKTLTLARLKKELEVLETEFKNL